MRLQIEVDDTQHADAMEKAYRRLAPRVQIRGFRPGKAPRPLIEKQLGHHRILHEAVDILLPEVYKQALEENDITPAGQPCRWYSRRSCRYSPRSTSATMLLSAWRKTP
jgi:trigger factor